MPAEERRPCCGVLRGTPHLRNCPATRRPGGENYGKPTPRQIDLARQLQRELGEYGGEDPEQLTFVRCSALIERLLTMKRERGDGYA